MEHGGGTRGADKEIGNIRRLETDAQGVGVMNG